MTNLIIYLLLVAAVAVAGEKKRIGFGSAFLISLFFTPVAGVIAVLLSNKADRVRM